MSESNDRAKSSAMKNSSLKIDAYPRDLLQRFISSPTEAATGSTNTTPAATSTTTPTTTATTTTTSSSSGLTYKTPNEETEELELTLGLSLGGQFGVDKSVKGLIRSSSIAGSIPFTRENDTAAPSVVSIIRTSSLPTETEEERRKRKEIQTLRRIEAKRRLTEKQRSFKGGGEEERQIGLVLRERVERSRIGVEGKAGVAPPFGLPSWAAAARQGNTGGGCDGGSDGDGNRKIGCLGQQTSQGSVEQRGGTSSGESNYNPLRGLSYGEGRRASSDRPLSEQPNQEAAAGPSGRVPSRTSSLDPESSSKKPDRAESRGKDIDINTNDDMPWVFTKGNGPNGRRVDGVLYKYGKGEEVRIMCVCHGSFHSPAEFVRHAGGTDVTNPLRHIVVSRNPASFS